MAYLLFKILLILLTSVSFRSIGFSVIIYIELMMLVLTSCQSALVVWIVLLSFVEGPLEVVPFCIGKA